MRRKHRNIARDAQIVALAQELAGIFGCLPTCIEVHEQARRAGINSVSPDNVHAILWRAGVPHSQAGTGHYREALGKERRAAGIAKAAAVAAGVAASSVQPTEYDGIDQAGEIEYLRQQLRESRRQATDALQRVGGQSEFYRMLREEVRALPPAPRNFDLTPHGDPAKHPQELLALIACLHIGERVWPKKTFELGDYDLRMAYSRIEYFVEKVIDLARNHHKGERFTRLWVACLGDTVSGTIHKALRRNAEFGITRQVTEAGNLLSYMLRDFAGYFPEVVFIGYPGNHGRIDPEPEFFDKADNYDTLAYVIAKERTRDIPNIEVRIPESFFTIEEINGHRFLFTHGDMIRSWAGIPWYGKDRARANLRELVSRLNLNFEYFCTSHFHTTLEMQETYGKTFFTGSSKGPCGYSTASRGVGSDPEWLLMGVHNKIGKTFDYDVNMKWAAREAETRYWVAREEEMAE